MHELSLAAAVLRIVEDAAERDRFSRVETLELEVGVLAGVDVGALRFAFEAMSPGTLLEGAELRIAEPEGRAYCVDCAEQVTISARGDACPRCGEYGLRPTGGTELRVLRLTVGP